nr:verprolin-like [Procambarus clarkii]
MVGFIKTDTTTPNATPDHFTTTPIAAAATPIPAAATQATSAPSNKPTTTSAPSKLTTILFTTTSSTTTKPTTTTTTTATTTTSQPPITTPTTATPSTVTTLAAGTPTNAAATSNNTSATNTTAAATSNNTTITTTTTTTTTAFTNATTGTGGTAHHSGLHSLWEYALSNGDVRTKGEESNRGEVGSTSSIPLYTVHNLTTAAPASAAIGEISYTTNDSSSDNRQDSTEPKVTKAPTRLSHTTRIPSTKESLENLLRLIGNLRGGMKDEQPQVNHHNRDSFKVARDSYSSRPSVPQSLSTSLAGMFPLLPTLFNKESQEGQTNSMEEYEDRLKPPTHISQDTNRPPPHIPPSNIRPLSSDRHHALSHRPTIIIKKEGARVHIPVMPSADFSSFRPHEAKDSELRQEWLLRNGLSPSSKTSRQGLAPVASLGQKKDPPQHETSQPSSLPPPIRSSPPPPPTRRPSPHPLPPTRRPSPPPPPTRRPSPPPPPTRRPSPPPPPLSSPSPTRPHRPVRLPPPPLPPRLSNLPPPPRPPRPSNLPPPLRPSRPSNLPPPPRPPRLSNLPLPPRPPRLSNLPPPPRPPRPSNLPPPPRPPHLLNLPSTPRPHPPLPVLTPLLPPSISRPLRPKHSRPSPTPAQNAVGGKSCGVSLLSRLEHLLGREPVMDQFGVRIYSSVIDSILTVECQHPEWRSPPTAAPQALVSSQSSTPAPSQTMGMEGWLTLDDLRAQRLEALQQQQELGDGPRNFPDHLTSDDLLRNHRPADTLPLSSPVPTLVAVPLLAISQPSAYITQDSVTSTEQSTTSLSSSPFPRVSFLSSSNTSSTSTVTYTNFSISSSSTPSLPYSSSPSSVSSVFSKSSPSLTTFSSVLPSSSLPTHPLNTSQSHLSFSESAPPPFLVSPTITPLNKSTAGVSGVQSSKEGQGERKKQEAGEGTRARRETIEGSKVREKSIKVQEENIEDENARKKVVEFAEWPLGDVAPGSLLLYNVTPVPGA